MFKKIFFLMLIFFLVAVKVFPEYKIFTMISTTENEIKEQEIKLNKLYKEGYRIVEIAPKFESGLIIILEKKTPEIF